MGQEQSCLVRSELKINILGPLPILDATATVLRPGATETIIGTGCQSGTWRAGDLGSVKSGDGKIDRIIDPFRRSTTASQGLSFITTKPGWRRNWKAGSRPALNQRVTLEPGKSWPWRSLMKPGQSWTTVREATCPSSALRSTRSGMYLFPLEAAMQPSSSKSPSFALAAWTNARAYSHGTSTDQAGPPVLRLCPIAPSVAGAVVMAKPNVSEA